ncbi:MAG: FKBP-type peptidyl-prolyl cis-trans isomerase [Patescibacteria group bacterium]|mgnify:CR=1 FL=1
MHTKTFFIFLVLILAVGTAAWLFSLKNDAPLEPMSTDTPTVSVAPGTDAPLVTPEIRTLEGGLQVQDYVVGKGAEAQPGMVVTAHYRGTLMNGTEFDASYNRGQPFSFTLGAGQVIRGWDLGIAGMRVGGKRVLVIPSALGYGASGAGDIIPPNADLRFEVELVGVAPQAK